LLLDVPQGRERLEALAAELGADRAVGIARDLSTDAAWDEVLAGAARAFGAPPGGAVLCAGGYAGGVSVHASADDAAWRRMMALNADTVHLALRKLLPPMVANHRGSVVVVGSRQVARPWTGDGAAAYAASKAAVVALAQGVAQEVLAHGVRVNAVLPSVLDTPQNRASMPDVDPKQWVELPSLAGVIAFLLSEEARDITGAAIPVYGRA
jgi:NAD(P)-dependent dehydrogenase (short-subunit alcohol dehydrogenase family)